MTDPYTLALNLETDIENARKAFSLLEDAGLPVDLQHRLIDWLKGKEKNYRLWKTK